MYKIEFNEKARKIIKKIDNPIKKKIIFYLENKIVKDPFAFGKPLTGNMSGLWRYRVENYRIICDIQKKELIVLIVKIGHRSVIYK